MIFKAIALLAVWLAVWLAGTGIAGAVSPSDFVRAKGRGLVVGAEERPVRLRGINFSNDVWAPRWYIIEQSPHHGAVDFERVAAMGMNVIRFHLSYLLFEDDDAAGVYVEEGWQWLEQEIGLARENGLYLILNMQRPQGEDFLPSAQNPALWEDDSTRQRLIELWRTIAERFRDETTIAAYDLINEPYPTAGLTQWQELAQDLVDAIRSVDPNHLIIVEVAHGSRDYEPFLVSDDNVMYDDHLYAPMSYSHQYLAEVGHGDGGFYPDPGVSVKPDAYDWVAVIDNPRIGRGATPWRYYEGEPYRVDDPRVVLASPVLDCGNSLGTVCFDDLQVWEYDEDGTLVRRVMWIDIEDVPTNEEQWYPGAEPFHSFTRFWQPWPPQTDPSHYPAVGGGHLGDSCLAIVDAGAGMSLSSWWLSFAVRQGYSYQADGWMRGIDVTGDGCQISLDLFALGSGEERVPFDRLYLESTIHRRLVQFSIDNNVPINVGELGLVRYCFEQGIGGDPRNRGGLEWVVDMLDILERYDISYQYLGYHLSEFGLYTSIDEPPTPEAANQPLIDLLSERLFQAQHPPRRARRVR